MLHLVMSQTGGLAALCNRHAVLTDKAPYCQPVESRSARAAQSKGLGSAQGGADACHTSDKHTSDKHKSNVWHRFRKEVTAYALHLQPDPNLNI